MADFNNLGIQVTCVLDDAKTIQTNLQRVLDKVKLSAKVGDITFDEKAIEAKLQGLLKSVSNIGTEFNKSFTGINLSELQQALNMVNQIQQKQITDKISITTNKDNTPIRTTTEITDEYGRQVKIVDTLNEKLTTTTTNYKKQRDEAEKLGNELYSNLNKLQKQEFEIKQRLVGVDEESARILREKLSLVQQQQNDTGKSLVGGNLVNEDKNNQLLLNRKKLVADLELTQTKANNKNIEETNRVKNAIENYQKSMANSIQMLQTKYKDLVPTSQLQQFQQNLKNLKADNIKELRTEIQKLNNDFGKLTADTKSSGLHLAQQDARSFTDSLLNASSKFTQWYLLAGGITGVIGALKEGVFFVNDLNKKLTEISIVTGKSQEQVSQLADEYRNLAYTMGVTTKNIADASVEYYRQGLSQQNVMERVRQTTEYAKVSNLGFKESAEILTATVNSMGVSIEKASDTFAYLGDKTATGADEVGKAFQRVGGTAAALQVDFDKVSSWIATISSRTREGAESIGNGIKSIMARYQQLREEGFVEEDGTQVNNVAKALATAGITMIDSQGQFRNFGTVMDELGAKWSSLDSRTKAYISTNLAGTYQMSRFQNLMNGYAESVDLYNGALNASGTTQQKYNLYLESTEAKLNKLRTVFEGIAMKVFDSGAIQGIITGLTKLLEVLGNLPAVIGLASAALFTFKGQAIMGVIQGAKTLVVDLMAITAGESALTVASVGATSAVNALKVALLSPLGVTIIALTAIAVAFTRIKDTAKEAEQVIQNVNNTLNETKQTDQLISQYQELQKQIAEDTQAGKDNKEAKKQLLDIQKQFGQTFKTNIDGFTAEGEAILKNLSAVKKLNEEKKKQAIQDATISYNNLQNTLKDDAFGSDVENYLRGQKNLQKALDSGDYEKADKINKTIQKYRDEINKYNELAVQLYSLGVKDVQIIDLETGAFKKYTQAINENSNAKTANAQSSTSVLGGQISDYERLKTLQDEVNKNGVSSGAENVIQGNYKDLIPYLNDEVALRQKINELINEQADNVKQATDKEYQSAVANQEKLAAQAKEQMSASIQSYETLVKLQKDLQENGVTADVTKTILKDYSQLIPYLNDEVALRDEINKLIDGEVSAQQKAYQVMMMNDRFCRLI